MQRRFEQQARSRIVNTCFDRVAEIEELKNKWICVKVWLQILRQFFTDNNHDDLLRLDDRCLKKFLLGSHRFARNNNVCPSPAGYYFRDRKKRKTMGSTTQTQSIQVIMVTDKGQLPPISNTPWYSVIITEVPPSFLTPHAAVPNPTVPNPTVPNDIVNNITPPRQRCRTAPPPAFMDQFTDYFQSPEAKKLFAYLHPTSNEERSKPVEEIILSRIQRFYYAVHSVTGWREVLEDEDANNKCSERDVFKIRHKCLFLYEALTIFVNKKRAKEYITLKGSCREAIDKIKSEREAVVELIKDSDEYTRADYPCVETMMIWLREFRRNRESFVNVAKRRSQNRTLPPFLDNNPDARQKIIEFARENIAKLSGELLYQYIHNEILPDLLQRRREETRNQNMTLDDLLKENHLKYLTLATVYGWMRALNFKYEVRKKTYYVDGHERPETVEYRKVHNRKYIKDEFRCFRWIQIQEEEVNELISDGIELKKEHAHKFEKHGLTFFEFHVDDCDYLQSRCNNDDTPFGGHLSVRMPPGTKPLIKFGQDECIFKQYLISTHKWYLHDGTNSVDPKTEGDGVMISAFVSRDFGFGLPLTHQQLQDVNRYRQNQHYLDKDAAKKLDKNNSTQKPQLVTSPFVHTFDYGSSQEGYWGYDHIIIQFEDCIDVLCKLYGNQYEYVFYFDHSSGHDRLRPDGLNVNEMNKGYGGSQVKMRNTTIQSITYLGPHSPILQVGDVQKMSFQFNDNGPFWLSEEEKRRSKNDRVSDIIEKKKYTKKQLLTALKEKTGMQPPHANIKQIQDLAIANDLPIEFEQRKTKEGWAGKPKGMMQVLFERGFIDREKPLSFYKINGRKNEDGTEVPGSNIKKLIRTLPDFKEELTLLQYRAEQLNVRVECSPKYHPEIAGEGIEYAWGLSKNVYRKLPLGQKETIEGFRKSVEESLDTKTVLTKERMRSFSKRQRRYVLAYLGIEFAKDNCDNNNQLDGIQLPEMSCRLVERLIKVFKQPHRTHRNIIDQDSSYIDDIYMDKVVDWMKSSVSQSAPPEQPTDI